MTTRSKAKSQKGQSLVELALVLPIVLIIMFGIMEFGRIFNAYLVISNASREGARYAAVGTADDQVEDAVEALVGPLGSVVVTITYEDLVNSERAVIVEVEHDFQLIVPIIRELISDTSTIKIKASTEMRVEVSD